MQRKFRSLLLYPIVLLPVLIFCISLTGGFDYLIYQYLVDDAFYYFQLSKHIPAFNVGIPNTGFHPLYAFLIAPFQNFFDYRVAIPASLSILIVSYCASTYIIYRLIGRYWSESIAVVTAAIWAANPMMYRIAMMGVETMLSVTLVLAAFYKFSQIHQTEIRQVPSRDFFVLGMISAVAFLARMDTPLILFPMMLYVLGWLLVQKRWKASLSLCLPPLLIPVSWMGYMKSVTGSIAPTSGQAIRVHLGIYDQLLAGWNLIVTNLQKLLIHIVDFFYSDPLTKSMEIAALSILLLVFVFSVKRVLNRYSDERLHPTFILTVLIAAGTVVIYSYYVFYQGKVRIWYSAYLGVALFIIYIPVVLAAVRSVLGKFIQGDGVRYKAIALAVLAIGVGGVYMTFHSNPQAAAAYDKYKSALIADTLLPEARKKSKIGAFNAGIYNYFMKREVINLDGVVNADVLKALKKETLDRYIKRNNIRYLIEHDIEQASNVERLTKYRSIKLQKWINLTKYYKGYNNQYDKDTYLWKIQYRESKNISSLRPPGKKSRTSGHQRARRLLEPPAEAKLPYGALPALY